ncbi:MAG: hypothetical protein P4M13_03845 [Alphaproteobacteria bacterium]|nr:hypothetical protein [Alphaproteobacteria bacterium]
MPINQTLDMMIAKGTFFQVEKEFGKCAQMCGTTLGEWCLDKIEGASGQHVTVGMSFPDKHAVANFMEVVREWISARNLVGWGGGSCLTVIQESPVLRGTLMIDLRKWSPDTVEGARL